jgi:hypothetical protein
VYTIPHWQNQLRKNPTWTQSHVYIIPRVHIPTLTKPHVETILIEHNPTLTQSHVDAVPRGYSPKWTQSHVDAILPRTIHVNTIPREHNPTWTQSHVNAIPHLTWIHHLDPIPWGLMTGRRLCAMPHNTEPLPDPEPETHKNYLKPKTEPHKKWCGSERLNAWVSKTAWRKVWKNTGFLNSNLKKTRGIVPNNKARAWLCPPVRLIACNTVL